MQNREMTLRDGALGSTVRQFRIWVLTLPLDSCVNIGNYLTSLGLGEIKQNLLLNHRAVEVLEAPAVAQRSNVRMKMPPSWRGQGKPYRQGAT